MKLTFYEFPEFTKRLLAIGDDEMLRSLQNELINTPDKGDVIAGTGGFRKVRIAAKGHGKRGGARVIYLRVPEAAAVVLVFIYTKGDATDLTSEQRAGLRERAAKIKEWLCPKK